MDEVRGTAADDINVAIQNGDVVFNLFTNQDNMVSVAAYDTLTSKNSKILDGTYVKSENNKVSTILNIVLSNPTNHVIKLYSLAPGNEEVKLNDARSYKFDLKDYYGAINGSNEWTPNDGSSDDYGVFIASPKTENTPVDQECELQLQTMNQFITFRTIDRFGGETINGRPGAFYKIGNTYSTNFYLSGSEEYVTLRGNAGAAMYPYVNSAHSLSIGNEQNEREGRMNQNSLYVQITPGQSITVPIMFEYNMNGAADTAQYSKAMSFDLRTSLYQDPITYTFVVTANKKPTAQDTLQQANRDVQRMVIYQPTVNK